MSSEVLKQETNQEQTFIPKQISVTEVLNIDNNECKVNNR